MINPSFSIHSWIVIEIDAKMTLFTKSGSVRVYYDDYALMSEILTPNQSEEYYADISPVTNIWMYVTFSFKLTALHTT